MSQFKLICKIYDLCHEIETTQLIFFFKKITKLVFLKIIIIMLNDEIKKKISKKKN
jgi:hypothetical protein